MIKLVIFDLDGVLVSTKKLHFDALNLALREVGAQYEISMEEHLRVYDGLPTTKKLNILTKEKGLPSNAYDFVWATKQKITEQLIEKEINKNAELAKTLLKLRKLGVKIHVATNSIEKTTYTILTRLGIFDLLDSIVTNQDIYSPKPNPEIYLRCMIEAGVKPNETLILEDSVHGIEAAVSSGAHVLSVKSPDEVTFDFINTAINKHKNMTTTPWISDDLNILIPMAGGGTRFAAAGYTFPKPLIEVRGKPMIQAVVENINIKAHYIFVVQKSHYEKYNLKYLLNLITPGCDIIQVDGVTEGAACTTLLARNLINTNTPLLMANSDQYVDWNSSEFMYHMINKGVDAGILTFPNTHPKWSYVKTDENGYVTEVAEKKPISNRATVGIYYWKKGSDYVKYAEQMIRKDIRVNNEFYVCPVFNEAVEDEKKIRCYDIAAENMWGIGTPEDLNNFLENHV
jgi:HAD superfamily hydrolase (TIGR01509 family)